MYAGFISAKKVLPSFGVHQRFDAAAFCSIKPYIRSNNFPDIEQIYHFEGFNGPDGLKIKSPGVAEPVQLYNPLTDYGEVPLHLGNHYADLVQSLTTKDVIRASFDASWLAHFITDGLTPAHHYPLHEKMAEIRGTDASKQPESLLGKGFHMEPTVLATIRKNWAIWGGKGELSTHFNFEMGVAATLVGHRLIVPLDEIKLAEARRLGAVEFFKSEARDIAALDMYQRFYDKGWNASLASLVKNRLAPQIVQTIAITWLLAYLEAGFDNAKIDSKKNLPRGR